MGVFPTPTGGGGGGGPPTGAAGGDLGGNYPNPTTPVANAAISAESATRAASDALLAPLASPAFTGNPLVPTQAPGTNNTRAASTQYADAAVAASGGGPPSGAAGGDLGGNYPNPTTPVANAAVSAESAARAAADTILANLAYQRIPHLVAPPMFTPNNIGTAVVTATLVPRGHRVWIPETGHLRDLSVYVGVSSGNISVAIYDTGDTTAGSRTKLYDSGIIACPAGGAWQIVADPNLAVTQGQALEILVCADNAVATFGRWTSVSLTAGGTLPVNFAPVAGGANPKLSVTYPAIGALNAWAAAVTEGNVGAASAASCHVVIGRIS